MTDDPPYTPYWLPVTKLSELAPKLSLMGSMDLCLLLQNLFARFMAPVLALASPNSLDAETVYVSWPNGIICDTEAHPDSASPQSIRGNVFMLLNLSVSFG